VLIRVESIKPEGLFLDFEESAGALPVLKELNDTGGVSFLNPIAIRLQLFRVGDSVEMKGTVEADPLLTCSRCLDEFEAKISADFSLIFLQESAAKEEKEEKKEPEEVELSEDELGVIFFSGDTIDPGQTLQEQILMALPLQPLCQEQCRGLCPQCGSNLNREVCSCEPPVFNNKFSFLKDILKP